MNRVKKHHCLFSGELGKLQSWKNTSKFSEFTEQRDEKALCSLPAVLDGMKENLLQREGTTGAPLDIRPQGH